MESKPIVAYRLKFPEDSYLHTRADPDRADDKEVRIKAMVAELEKYVRENIELVTLSDD